MRLRHVHWIGTNTRNLRLFEGEITAAWNAFFIDGKNSSVPSVSESEFDSAVTRGGGCLQFRNCSDQPVNIRASKVAENRYFHKRGEISGRATEVGFEKSVVHRFLGSLTDAQRVNTVSPS